MDFHCYECGDPITGGVSQTRCIDCLLGIEDGPECALCGEPCPHEEEHCDSCQEELDAYDDSWFAAPDDALLVGDDADV